MTSTLDTRGDVRGDLDAIDDVDVERLALARVGPGDSAETRRGGEEGMATAEYAVGVIAACGFAGLLVKLLSSDDVMQILVSLIQKAVSLFL